jgi:threonine dehydratase
VEIDEVDTLADSLQGGIGLDNDVTFPIVAALVDEVVLVTEDEIAAGMVWALAEHRLVLEGGGAVGIAAILAGKAAATDGAPVVVVCSGANAELAQIARLAAAHHGGATAADTPRSRS